MKNKSRIFKALGVGTLCATSILGFAGCSEIELTKEQVNSIIDTCDKSQQFMNEYSDLITNQVNQLELDRAWNLFELAEMKLRCNYDNIWANLKYNYKTTQDYENAGLAVYKFNVSRGLVNGLDTMFVDGDTMAQMLVKNETTGKYTGYFKYYDSESGNWDYDIADGKGNNDSEENLAKVNSLYPFADGTPFTEAYQLEKENLKKLEINENGEYVLHFASIGTTDEGNGKTFSTGHVVLITMTQQGLIKTLKSQSSLISYTGYEAETSPDYFSSTNEIIFDYNSTFDSERAYNILQEIQSNLE